MALFNRKNKEDNKKGRENIVGKIIYIFLLFAPLFSILTTSLYAIFNKNAYKSYSNFNIEESHYEVIDNYNELIVGNKYKYISNTNIENLKETATGGIAISNVEYLNVPSNAPSSTDVNYLTIWKYTNIKYLSFNVGSNYNQSSNFFEFTFIFEGYVNINQTQYDYSYYLDNSIYQWQLTQTTNTLDNAFEYSISKVEDSNLYNWSKTTAIYTVMQTTTTQLGITNTFTPMLLTYWLVISIIYFIYDIALMLIWILHRKIHELTESV